MATRIDYNNDPNAPRPNSIRPAASALVVDDANRILLIKRTDNSQYALPGGAMDFGESLTETAIRECREETGYEIKIVGLVGIYTDPGHVIHYTSNDEVRQEFAVVFHGEATGRSGSGDGEASEVRWVPVEEALTIQPMPPSTRTRIATYVSGKTPHIDRPRRSC